MAGKKDKSKLTPKQAKFVEEYLVDLNATAAARRAGYSEKRASEIAYQLLQKTTVQTAIARRRQANFPAKPPKKTIYLNAREGG